MEQAIVCRFVQGIGAGAIMPVAYTAGGRSLSARRARQEPGAVRLRLLPRQRGGAAAHRLPGRRRSVGARSSAWTWCSGAWRRRPVVADGRARRAAAAIAWTWSAPRCSCSAWARCCWRSRCGSRGVDWLAPTQLALYVLGGGGSAAFVWWEARVAEPLLPLALFRHRVVLGACLVTLLMGSCLWSMGAFVPLLVQGVQGGSAFQRHPYLAARECGSGLSAAPWRCRCSGAGATAGPACGDGGLVIGYAVLAQASGDSGAWRTRSSWRAWASAGFGLGFVNSAVTIAVQNAVPWAERATATSTLQIFRQFGPSVTIAALQTLLNAQFAAHAAAQGIAATALGPAAGAQANALLAPDLQASLPPALLDGPAHGAGTRPARDVLARRRGCCRRLPGRPLCSPGAMLRSTCSSEESAPPAPDPGGSGGRGSQGGRSPGPPAAAAPLHRRGSAAPAAPHSWGERTGR